MEKILNALQINVNQYLFFYKHEQPSKYLKLLKMLTPNLIRQITDPYILMDVVNNGIATNNQIAKYKRKKQNTTAH